MIPITAILCVRNESQNLPHSLPPLQKYFDEVLVVDSKSHDGTGKLATHQFTWNGQYPKKRQWVLDNIPTKHDWVLMIDADEIVTDDFITELQSLDFSKDGYFISSQMVWKNKLLKHGQRNNKLCLFKKSVFHFPVIDDLDIAGMGEIEGHYQPVSIHNATIGQIKSPIIHHDRKGNWHDRHDKYVRWESEMNKRKAWPIDPIPWREFFKSKLRISYARPIAVFTYGYIFKFGFLDGRVGFDYALNRARYTWRIVRAIRQTTPSH